MTTEALPDLHGRVYFSGMTRRALAMLLLLVTSAPGQQQNAPSPAPADAAPSPARVSYTVERENRDPARFTLTVDRLGHATYTAEEATGDSKEAEGEGPAPPYHTSFDVSPATRDRIFTLAQALDYFDGDFEFRKHKVADTGRKTFRYSDGARQGETVLHWSENKQMQQLTDLCESIALTQNFARRLVYLRRFDRLGLDAALKRMEELAKGNYLAELQTIAPGLRQVADDPDVMHVARQRASRLLELAAAAPAGAAR